MFIYNFDFTDEYFLGQLAHKAIVAGFGVSVAPNQKGPSPIREISIIIDDSDDELRVLDFIQKNYDGTMTHQELRITHLVR